jgi:hypothetical protein
MGNSTNYMFSRQSVVTMAHMDNYKIPPTSASPIPVASRSQEIIKALSLGWGWFRDHRKAFCISPDKSFLEQLPPSKKVSYWTDFLICILNGTGSESKDSISTMRNLLCDETSRASAPPKVSASVHSIYYFQRSKTWKNLFQGPNTTNVLYCVRMIIRQAKNSTQKTSPTPNTPTTTMEDCYKTNPLNGSHQVLKSLMWYDKQRQLSCPHIESTLKESKESLIHIADVAPFKTDKIWLKYLHCLLTSQSNKSNNLMKTRSQIKVLWQNICIDMKVNNCISTTYISVSSIGSRISQSNQLEDFNGKWFSNLVLPSRRHGMHHNST